jgi:Zn ribbon nucleic-acid-binding protein
MDPFHTYISNIKLPEEAKIPAPPLPVPPRQEPKGINPTIIAQIPASAPRPVYNLDNRPQRPVYAMDLVQVFAPEQEKIKKASTKASKCFQCGITQTALWRTGPNGIRLCNKHGLRYQKQNRGIRKQVARQEQRAVGELNPVIEQQNNTLDSKKEKLDKMSIKWLLN